MTGDAASFKLIPHVSKILIARVVFDVIEYRTGQILKKVVLNRKRGAVKAQLTRIKDFINNPDEKDKIKLESKMDTLKILRIKLRDIRNEYYEVVVNDSDLEPLELYKNPGFGRCDCEDIQVRIKNIISKIDLKNNDVTSCGNTFKNIKLPDI
ncbi:hypothetical protein TNCT_681231 [Trichonephila clavata]|uniref:Uncharacterized protein n=1 Tax=Trichonephila clavata TaxID=2740835 RepID=A0A8X6FCX5_TRICU|nr:hypothetical protein TNCT_681231 [Trichonephila clavata]